MNNHISIIIRTKNEEKWLARCLEAIKLQKIDRHLEIVVVDSGSSDRTCDVAISHGCTLVQIQHYRPGYAINEGIRVTNSDVVVVLSAHCIPIDELWLTKLTQPLYEPSGQIAACYGRQIPTPGSDPNDVRDLLITFGIEDRVQTKDTFFHNANSAIKRSAWEEYPFDNSVTNIEDRLWAESLIRRNKQIKYCSEATVFHWHGIHQYGNQERALLTASILKEQSQLSAEFLKYSNHSEWITGIVLVRFGEVEYYSKLLKRLLSCLCHMKQKWRLVIFSSIDFTKSLPTDLGIEIHWIKRPDIGEDSETFAHSLQECIELFEKSEDCILQNCAVFNLTYLWRDYEDLELLVSKYMYYDYDIVIPHVDIFNDGRTGKNSLVINPKVLTDTPASLINSLHRSTEQSETRIPGYMTVFRASLLRMLETKTCVRLASISVFGQEKLLKADGEDELASLLSRVDIARGL